MHSTQVSGSIQTLNLKHVKTDSTSNVSYCLTAFFLNKTTSNICISQKKLSCCSVEKYFASMVHSTTSHHFFVSHCTDDVEDLIMHKCKLFITCTSIFSCNSLIFLHKLQNFTDDHNFICVTAPNKKQCKQ